MNVWLAVASALTFAVWLIHTFSGGPAVAKPLLDSNMETVPKLTNYYCWHIVTLTLAAMSGGYLYAALVPEGRDVAILVTLLALAYAAWGIALMRWKRQRFVDMPQWLLFVIVCAPAIVGVLRS